MEVSMRILNPLNLNHRFFSKAHQSLGYLPPRPAALLLPRVRHARKLPPLVASRIRHDAVSSSYFPCSSVFPNSSPLGFLLSLSSSLFSPPRNHHHLHGYDGLGRLNAWCNDGGLISWYGPQDPVDGEGAAALADRGCQVTVVLLGWLGAKPRHLKKYAELYTSRGFSVVTFAVSVSNVLWADLGRSIEERIRELVNQLVSWLSEPEKDGRSRFLIFHTFSNTGWLVYGVILNHLQSRPELIDKIRGCIVDSGAAPELSPQVWAAGFATAMLKKRSHVVYGSAEFGNLYSDGTMPKMQEKMQSFIETLLLLILEKTFSYLLKLPDVNRRLSKIMLILSENQPCCPQLYLYSTADKVIPFRSVESFMDDQRRNGKKVLSFNFLSSPHVDHYRRFPDIYSTNVDSFLSDCLATLRQT
ncbi:hypothetical protein Dimus_014198 [Dionaea muscipula]